MAEAHTFSITTFGDSLSGHVSFSLDGVAYERRCCRTLMFADSHRESMWLDGRHEQTLTRPLSHHELVQLHHVALQAGVVVDRGGQGRTNQFNPAHLSTQQHR